MALKLTCASSVKAHVAARYVARRNQARPDIVNDKEFEGGTWWAEIEYPNAGLEQCAPEVARARSAR